MKLFITNKKKLEDYFPEDGNNKYSSAKEIHQRAYKELDISLKVNYSIPLCLMPSYKDDGVVLLDFINKKDDIYFYEFTTTAS